MWYESVIAIIGSLGGFELVKWLINRKNNVRISEAEADMSEFHTLQEMIQFLQTELKEKEERFAEQTTLVRKLNAEVIELTNEKASIELELALKRCDDQNCPFRQPPNAQTPPKPGLTREAYHANKTNPQNQTK